MSRLPIVVFAQTPPPEHGQSRMVASLLEVLRVHEGAFEVVHINARFSLAMEEIGESSLRKAGFSLKYLWQALQVRRRLHKPALYYVPGPVKWSSVLRDWFLLPVLRLAYRRVIFHWHAVGQGEWAHGSGRLRLPGPEWLDRLARAISARVLRRPFGSLAVSPTTQTDALAVGSGWVEVVCNGLADPCPDFDASCLPDRQARQREIAAAASPVFRVLFLSHGSIEKGLVDALEALESLLARPELDPAWCFELTLAGGFDRDARELAEAAIARLGAAGSNRLVVRRLGFVLGDEKNRCYREHDIFLAPSRWESFGLTVAEAMAHGMPVVAAAADGVRGVLPEGYPYLAPVARPAALADRLLACCRDLAGGNGFASQCAAFRRRFLDHFQLDGFAARALTVLADRCGAARTTVPAGATVPPTAAVAIAPPARLRVAVYLADQNPARDRSLGISSMTRTLLRSLEKLDRIEPILFTSSSSLGAQGFDGMRRVRLPVPTNARPLRVLVDNLHRALLPPPGADAWFYPKGYLPWLVTHGKPTVATIHDTILQHYADHYPEERSAFEYRYWIGLIKRTLRNASMILTVSNHAHRQILAFCDRYRITPPGIRVIYEGSDFETWVDESPAVKCDAVVHLASVLPHKKTRLLLEWWRQFQQGGDRHLPELRLIGRFLPADEQLARSLDKVHLMPFLPDEKYAAEIRRARALILPSEIEGFGLPALEAYYLGTPVCYVRNTSVEEVLDPSTTVGGFSLDDPASLRAALDQVLTLAPAAVAATARDLRRRFSSHAFATAVTRAFEDAVNR